ncbi:hypothetical protein [Cryptosporangium minutisporangium]|uniref:hypothetical protein n=1 Tax=Cryptosporangium minutisporangium TaxID=113569 RepID=UPI0035EA6FB5
MQTEAGQEASADSTADTQLLRQVADADAPVFLDTTGRRRRRLRALVWLVGLAGLTYATILVVSLLGGHSTQSLTAAPEFRPGEKQSPPATAAPVATTEAELARPTDAAVDPRPTARATADGPATSPAARSPQPGRSGSQAARSPSAAPTASAPTPSASAAVPTPSPSAGVLDGLVDTLFPWAS